jgi:hypothetical protein
MTSYITRIPLAFTLNEDEGLLWPESLRYI